MIDLDLPFPPSTNTLFRNAGNRDGTTLRGRIRTKKYLAWIDEASKEAMAQRQNAIKGHVKLHIALDRPDKRKRDLSNYIKAPEDLLVSMGLIEDDSLVQRITIGWSKRGNPGRAYIEVWEAQ